MKNLKKAGTALLAAVFMAGGSWAVYAEDISVRMDSVTSYASEYVSFGEVKPIQIDNRTLIPARDMAEAAGMEVEWDQPTQTAILTLRADAYSDKPIERFAAAAIEQINGFGLNLTPASITAALKLNDSNAVIRYNFTDSEGDNVPIGKNYEMVSQAILINDGTLMVPVRDSMEMFGLTVDWIQQDLCAVVSIPDKAEIPDGMGIIANHGEGEYAAVDNAENENNSDNGLQLGEYIGNFKITHYCPCEICTGSWGGQTAWAGMMIPGQTIAVNPNIIPKLSWVYIDGYGYRHAEDTGGGVDEYQIDVAVPTHAMALELGVVYRDVYFAE